MFDIGWSELLVVGVVALIVVGPKELPALLRTIGRYVGVMKRHASEFRAQFDEAMRETELEQIRKDVENIRSETEASLRSAERSVHGELSDARREFETAGEGAQRNGNGAAAQDEDRLQGPVVVPDEATAPTGAEPTAGPATHSPNGSGGNEAAGEAPAGRGGA
jgi:sec-independent protein translocase protein TatB